MRESTTPAPHRPRPGRSRFSTTDGVACTEESRAPACWCWRPRVSSSCWPNYQLPEAGQAHDDGLGVIRHARPSPGAEEKGLAASGRSVHEPASRSRAPDGPICQSSRPKSRGRGRALPAPSAGTPAGCAPPRATRRPRSVYGEPGRRARLLSTSRPRGQRPILSRGRHSGVEPASARARRPRQGLPPPPAAARAREVHRTRRLPLPGARPAKRRQLHPTRQRAASTASRVAPDTKRPARRKAPKATRSPQGHPVMGAAAQATAATPARLQGGAWHPGQRHDRSANRGAPRGPARRGRRCAAARQASRRRASSCPPSGAPRR